MLDRKGGSPEPSRGHASFINSRCIGSHSCGQAHVPVQFHTKLLLRLAALGRSGGQALLLRHLFELSDGLGWLLATLLEIRTVDLCVLGHELTLASKGLLCRVTIHESFIELLQGVVLHGLVLKLADQVIFLLLVQLDYGVVRSHGSRHHHSTAFPVKEAFVAEGAVLICEKRVSVMIWASQALLAGLVSKVRSVSILAEI